VNATVINPSALPFTEDSTTEGANNDIDPTPSGCVQGAGADVVYSFTPSESAVYNLGVTPTGAGFDPSFYIITDCANPATSCIAGANNNGVGKGEFLSVNLAAGTHYFIVVDSPTTTSGAGAFHFSLRKGSPANDSCATPTVIPANRLPFTTMGTTIGATNDLNPQTPCLRSRQSGSGPEVIYQFTSADTQNYFITATPIGNFDVTLYVVTNCVSASDCSSSDSGGSGVPETVRRNMVAGSTYFIVVDGFGGDAGDFVLTVQPSIPRTPAPPTNLRATAVSSNRVDLNWDDNSGDEQGFRIERSLDAQTFTEIATVDPNVTSYTDNTVAPGTLYFYRVFAFNGFGNSDPTNIADVTTPTPPPPQNPVIVVNPTTLDFGTVRSLATLPVTISNNGATDLQITAISDPSAPFSIVDKPSLPLTIAPNQSRQITVRFTPTAAQAFASSFTISSNDPLTPFVTVNVRGTGSINPVPNISITTSLIDFPGGSSSFILEVNNTGDADLVVASILNPSSPFFISGQPQFPAVFKPGEGFLLTVAFSPSAVGVFQSAITIVCNDPDALLNTVYLRGASTATNEQLKLRVPASVNAIAGTPVSFNILAVNGGSGSDIRLASLSSAGTFTERRNGVGRLTSTPAAGATGRVILNFRATDSANRIKTSQTVINIVDAATVHDVQVILTPPDTAPNAPTGVLANDQTITLLSAVAEPVMMQPQVAAGLTGYLVYRSDSANVGVSSANLVGVLTASQTSFVDKVPAANSSKVFFYIVTAFYASSTESAASTVTSTAPRLLNVQFQKKVLSFQAANSNVAAGAVLIANGTEQFPLTRSGSLIIVEKNATSTPGGRAPKKVFKSGAQLQVRNPNGVTSATVTLP
jgi:hypothetical protein